MSFYNSLSDFFHIEGLKISHLIHLDSWLFEMEHRGIKIQDILYYQDVNNFREIRYFVMNLMNEIDYYLEAIWC